MRFVYPLLILLVVILSGSTWISTLVFADPKEEALAFLKDVQSGSLARSVKHFGGNSCRCPAKGGWGSYLIYVSGQEHNLAALTGHPFTIGKVETSNLPNLKKALIPWEKPEDRLVDVQLTFDQNVYQPLFLPLPMAFGKSMTEKQFDEFLADPDRDAWKGFTLRLRPSLQPGAVAPPKEELPREAVNEFEALKPKTEKETAASEQTMEAVRKALGAQATEYVIPKDAGAVIGEDGKPLPLAEVEKRLPRLSSATLRIHVVRRGQLQDWTIYHFGFMYPVLTLADGKTLKLEHDHPPGQE